MMASGIDLWDEVVRSRIEQFQLTLALVLRGGNNVVIEWGVWAREERDALREAARSIGVPVELRYVSAAIDELWRCIERRDLEGRWGSRSITRPEPESGPGFTSPPPTRRWRPTTRPSARKHGIADEDISCRRARACSR